MRNSRRDFIKKGVAGLAALSVASSGSLKLFSKKPEKASKSLSILILGGTAFTGPHQIKYAIDRGHKVSIFTRGKTKPTLNKEYFKKVEHLIGDRNNDLNAIKGKKWDAVIDNSATYPRWVKQSTDILKDNASTYLFTSSLSVHADFSIKGITENHPIATIDDPTIEDMSAYGPLKALSEKVAKKAFTDRAIIVRPHLIVGPGDRTDRWTYWPVRINRGGEVLAPGDPSQPAQYIDARDLSEFDIHLIENNLFGTYTAVGPLGKLTMSEMLYGIKAVVSNEVSFAWVDQNFILENKIKPWTEITAWMPSGGEFDGFCSFDNSNAVKAGIKYRPLAVTAKDTLKWWKTLPRERRENPKAGLSISKEKEVLKKWKSKIK
jgi:2'-hydroxyisoflavone reductase